jgi:hypothetical protein
MNQIADFIIPISIKFVVQIFFFYYHNNEEDERAKYVIRDERVKKLSTV